MLLLSFQYQVFHGNQDRYLIVTINPGAEFPGTRYTPSISVWVYSANRCIYALLQNSYVAIDTTSTTETDTLIQCMCCYIIPW